MSHYFSKEDCKHLEHHIHQLLKLGDAIMSIVSDFAAKQKEFNDRMDGSVDGLTQDIKTLNDMIVKLQSTQGQITPEDQALLDQIQAHSESMANKLGELDSLTPPPIPPLV